MGRAPRGGRAAATAAARVALLGLLTLAAFASLPKSAAAQTACGSVSDPTVLLPLPTDPKPALYFDYVDPQTGGCFKRITDAASNGTTEMVHDYSQLQAWNVDQSKILLATGLILNASDFSVYGQLPAMGAHRWSPTDPNLIYSTSGNSWISYNIATQTTTTIRTFPEYTMLDREASFEELPENDRYVLLEGYRVTDGGVEIFVYDYKNDVKSKTIPGTGPCGGADWLAMSPLGDYAMVNWGGGGSQAGCGLEAYDVNMNYVGKVALGHGHGDMTVDKDGTEYYVLYTHDNYDNTAITGPYVARYRIPRGYDDVLAGDSTGGVPLLKVDWSEGGHISGQALRAGFVLVSLSQDLTNGWQPLEGEEIKVYLDSREFTPHIERLAHHRSDEAYVASQPSSTCPLSAYWAQPHGSLSRDGTMALFGSSWGQNCTADDYLLRIPGGTSGGDTTPPAATVDLRVR